MEAVLALRNSFGFKQFCSRFCIRINFMTIKEIILEALEKKYDAEIADGDATIKIYLTNPVGIGEHPQHIEEVDKLISKICHAKEKKEELKNFGDL